MPKTKKGALGPKCVHIISPRIDDLPEDQAISPWHKVALIGCAKPEKCLAELRADPQYQKPPEQPRDGSRAQDSEESDLDPENQKRLDVLFSVINCAIRELESDARKLGSLTEDEALPEPRARQLREKVISGMFDWAIRRMGEDLEKYLEEGRRNFLDHFRLNHLYFEPKTMHYERFWEPFEKTRFFIPLKPGRRTVHHSVWPKAWEIYRDTLPVLQEIKRKTRGSKKSYLLALKEALPGLPEDRAENIWRMDKPSDGAAEYARWKLKLPVGVEALKEYFKVFHQRYSYWDFIARNLNRQK